MKRQSDSSPLKKFGDKEPEPKLKPLYIPPAPKEESEDYKRGYAAGFKAGQKSK